MCYQLNIISMSFHMESLLKTGKTYKFDDPLRTSG